MTRFFTTPQHGTALAFYIIGTIIVFVLFMAALHPTASAFKKRMTMVLSLIAGSFFLLEFLMPASVSIGGRTIGNPLTPYVQPLANAQLIFLSLALMLGIVNLFRINGRLVIRRRPGWWNGLAFFFGFFAMLTMGMLQFYYPATMTDAQVAALPPLAETVASGRAQYAGWYQVLFTGAFNSLGATVFSLLAFYIVSAAYRAFRVRNTEAVLLLMSALVMMLGLTPLGTYFLTGFIDPNGPYAFLKLDSISEWILTVLNGAAQQALLFGVAVGLIATSLRIWLSLERGHFFDVDM